MIKERDFALFIISHGRANDVKTLKHIKICGYTGDWYIVIDNEDEQCDIYYNNFGEDKVIMFDKYAISCYTDTCDIPRDRGASIFVRNALFDIAKNMGLKYFLVLDDDYDEFHTRIEKNGILSKILVRDIDDIINETLDFLIQANLDCVAWSQVGDFLGGLNSTMYKNRMSRKIMNSFFCDVSKPFKFVGRMNEDTNTYLLEGSRGKKFITIADISIRPQVTQKMKGGLQDMYRQNGTYVKSFFSVMITPSCVKVGEIGQFHKRIHHNVCWENAVPKIIREEFKKLK